LFIRFLPMISIFEMRDLVHRLRVGHTKEPEPVDGGASVEAARP